MVLFKEILFLGGTSALGRFLTKNRQKYRKLISIIWVFIYIIKGKFLIAQKFKPLTLSHMIFCDMVGFHLWAFFLIFKINGILNTDFYYYYLCRIVHVVYLP